MEAMLHSHLLERLLRARGLRLRPQGGDEHGLVHGSIDDLWLVARDLADFVWGVEAVAEYLGMMGMEVKLHKCAMATAKGVIALYLRFCPHLSNHRDWVAPADSIPYLGLKL